MLRRFGGSALVIGHVVPAAGRVLPYAHDAIGARVAEALSGRLPLGPRRIGVAVTAMPARRPGNRLCGQWREVGKGASRLLPRLRGGHDRHAPFQLGHVEPPGRGMTAQPVEQQLTICVAEPHPQAVSRPARA